MAEVGESPSTINFRASFDFSTLKLCGCVVAAILRRQEWYIARSLTLQYATKYSLRSHTGTLYVSTKKQLRPKPKCAAEKMSSQFPVFSGNSTYSAALALSDLHFGTSLVQFVPNIFFEIHLEIKNGYSSKFGFYKKKLGQARSRNGTSIQNQDETVLNSNKKQCKTL